MRKELQHEIVKRLERDYQFKRKSDQGWYQKGKCPECGERELYANASEPVALKCGRENNCGAVIYIRDIYRDLFESYSDRIKTTDAEPHAAADAYLREARGFALTRLRGLYTQERHYDQELRIGTATVRFSLPNGSWWERFIDRPERFGKQKAKFAPGKDRAGEWWQLPDSAKAPKQLWLSEGIFDAYALELNGVAARALMSCNNYPEIALKRIRAECEASGASLPQLVFALDDDKAGRSYALRWVRRARTEGWAATAAVIPRQGRDKIDWNDAHQRGTLTPKDREGYLYEGALLCAETPTEKARLIYKRTERASFHFEHGNSMYWAAFNDAAYKEAKDKLGEGDSDLSDEEIRDEALKRSFSVSEFANFNPTALYFQSNRLTNESWYYFRIAFPHGGQPVKDTFTATQIATASEFKKRAYGVARGAQFSGTTPQLDRVMKEMLFNIKEVETINFIGYTREHGCYVFGDVAVKDGVIYKRNDEDYFDIGKLSIKSLNESMGLALNLKREEYRSDWLNMIWACYGVKGMVSLAFWFGTLFAEQIRAKQQSLPFLEMSGEPGTGKSTLIDFLWKLVGRTGHEGTDPTKSTLAGRMRTFTQSANLPVVLIESDRGKEDDNKQKRFDWDEIKPLYNGHVGRAIGLKNSGTDTYDPPFRGSILIEQNAAVSASNAVMERIVHMTFDKQRHSAANKAIAEQLSGIDVSAVSGFALMAAQRERDVMKIITENTNDYSNQLMALADMKNGRLAKNHAQIMALVDALRLVVPMTDAQYSETHSALIGMALERQVAINADHPHVQTFWELFDYVHGDSEGSSLNHHRDEKLIAISLVELEARLSKAGSRLPCDMTELKRLLRTSQVRKFVDNTAINSRINNATKKCWVFRREA
ncbi:toprim domain-containing protein [Lysobacter gummosus]|uniref:Toprim domain-containing protein n=1 Tax=Lysobacter gummosus TaxID=262324 RepID=A0ABY3X925_9GAMM|nr:toprim domain-containing protein [Lysobacter gummosus]ALN92530.1 toprim-like family protein [Lysobacter gummosus]UNP28110.1 toprim domain-containing protein [Lysobacter gummosus]